MAGFDLDNLLASVPEQIAAPEVEVMSDEEFKLLTVEIDFIREKVTAKQPVSVDEARKIVVWFRARRRKNFTLKKVKEAKPAGEKKPRKAAIPRRKAASDMDALKLLEDL